MAEDYESLYDVESMSERERGRLRLILDNVSEAITAVFLDTGDTVRNRQQFKFMSGHRAVLP
mgnify:CR=1 FL=1